MKPYFVLGGATLYLGDCREVLPSLPRDSVDLIVTDPPYGVQYVSNYRADTFGSIAGDEDETVAIAGLQASLVVLRNARHVYVFGPLKLSSLPLTGCVALIWNKGRMGLGDLSSPWGVSHEPITFGVYQASQYDRRIARGTLAAKMRKGSILCVPRPDGNVARHPTEKPVPILRQMIESSSMLGETVLDPFAGSGSTLVAALIEGRKAIGIELDEKYAEVAAERIEEAAAWAAMMPK